MRIILFVAICSLASAHSTTIAQTASQTVTQVALLDDSHTKMVEGLIDKTIAGGDLEGLKIALHNKNNDIRMYCLNHMENLPVSQQAKFLSAVLNDDSLLQYSDDLPTGGSKQIYSQTVFQYRIQQLAHKLLKKSAPSFHGELSRAEAALLATELRSLQ